MPSRRELLCGLGGVALTGTAGCLDFGESRFSPGSDATTDWPMPRHDPENTAFARDAEAPRTGVKERWSGMPDSDVRTPAVVDGTVFAPAPEGLVALDGASGDELWRFAPTELPWARAPIVHDGTVYVTIPTDGLYAIDAKTGEEQWSLTEDIGRCRPHLLAGRLVENPLVLIGDERGVTHALDPANGEERWQIDLFGSIRTMAYRFHTLLIGTSGGELYAYYSQGGTDTPQELWRRKVGSRVESIVPTDNGIVVGTFDGPLRNLRDGTHAGTTDWTAEREHARSPPVHAGSWIYSTGWESLSSLRVYDKNLHWRVGGNFGNVGPVAAGDTLYVPGDDKVHAFDLSGGTGGGRFTFDAKRWSYPVENSGIQGLAVADGALFVACEAHEKNQAGLLCLEPK
ncbi:dehydrogenase [Haloferax mediterranei ATCC 33500]|uniref:Dehydrogenase n=1 Tax=Haloferax mediterranei (strain ATCC 33500 / DSM 1411 / JCM 8866 / NBRC 14739 / NCIMB 2177 / R-4) TaxID=523841 RepID=I3R1W1_HALMT|nr:PQQ-binding-like beta-propeller repeat protein [Haloferax mediterranei]AFK18221.1 PQQ repeat-containing protein [Haloferax mediterranei ATCC 33500]AHZ22378.1 dehydrogenase [Haloferax mediterranei ATCC 33500]EMA02508.1 PQQ repeat-containing protein [Haloferax mediterranei ATCC 33500]MDX5988309.1 PQQ-binding-like beta-propeller repeat protein [Haloferax mediterranei ATCC 33500]QCQ74744.1 dehydrogenase [Haloferax mediterranei ATCC 33500]